MEIGHGSIIGLIAGIAGALAGYLCARRYFNRKKDAGLPSGIAGLNETRRQQAEEAKKAVLKMFEEKEEVANDEVQEKLGVSDATATRYLEELEKEGMVEQIGDRGRSVKYRRR